MKSFIRRHRSVQIGGIAAAWVASIPLAHWVLRWLSVGADSNGLPKKYIRSGVHNTIQAISWLLGAPK